MRGRVGLGGGFPNSRIRFARSRYLPGKGAPEGTGPETGVETLGIRPITTPDPEGRQTYLRRSKQPSSGKSYFSLTRTLLNENVAGIADKLEIVNRPGSAGSVVLKTAVNSVHWSER
jgi:hypothetical protein